MALMLLEQVESSLPGMRYFHQDEGIHPRAQDISVAIDVPDLTWLA